jgi:hypothetical protein
MELEIGKSYKWKHDSHQLVYLSQKGLWHQFALIGTTKVWCEVVDEDLHMIEEIK